MLALPPAGGGCAIAGASIPIASRPPTDPSLSLGGPGGTSRPVDRAGSLVEYPCTYQAIPDARARLHRAPSTELQRAKAWRRRLARSTALSPRSPGEPLRSWSGIGFEETSSRSSPRLRADQSVREKPSTSTTQPSMTRVARPHWESSAFDCERIMSSSLEMDHLGFVGPDPDPDGVVGAKSAKTLSRSRGSWKPSETRVM